MNVGILFNSLKERIENLEKVKNICGCKQSDIFPCPKCGPAVSVVGGDCYQQGKDKLSSIAKRKVTQICNTETEAGSRLVVLCDDGTMWKMYYGDGVWDRIKGVPQDGEKV
jgi:hypothetical protein